MLGGAAVTRLMTIVLVATSSRLRSPRSQVTTPEDSLQLPDAVDADTKVTEPGRVSSKVTSVDVAGPWLATVRV